MNRPLKSPVLTALLLGVTFLVLGGRFGEEGCIAAGVAAVFLAIFWAVREDLEGLRAERISARDIDAAEMWGACGNKGCVTCRPWFDANNNVIPGSEL
ncbi:hypothetical protein PBI_HILLTOPFARM_58 [Mycobacterium phage Hilltopfarm]|nr:hypothetical protein PBI_HILLTOPFARM_58 [Mycobacterium phage Hilltopfarm]